jgi:ABC-type transport system substrate-binding protein
MADPTSPTYLDGFQDMLADVGIGKGQALSIHWRISHVRPEALFRLPLDQLAGTQDSLVAYQAFQEAEQPDVIRYSVPSQEAADEKMPTVVEQSFATEEEAISALIRKDVDVLSRISPWQVERLRRSEDLVVDSYRVPSVHVLIPNHSKPLLARREFRRALCYGIDRQQVLEQFILGGKKDAGFRVLSGPFPSGANRTDPVGYAYNQTIQPHPYEPRLGAVLSRVARTTLAKMAALKEEKESAEVAEEEATEKKVPEKKELPPPEPLLLVYPPEPVARTVCQTMKLQLDAIGIPIKLHELSPTSKELPANYDLFYAELAMWEPAVDAKRLLGPKGLAGSCTATMSLALQSIDTAQNWDQVRTRFRQVHKVAFGDLPVIPLWQTTNYFAYRRAVAGIGASPVSLYQDLPDWKINLDEVGP